MQGSEQQYVAADIDADTESRRLRLLEACRDPGTIRRLDRLGVSRGWGCLEVGAGHGSITRWLAERVGPTGSVIAADIDPRFLTDMPAGVDVRRFDIRHDDLEVDTYDLVHCRACSCTCPTRPRRSPGWSPPCDPAVCFWSRKVITDCGATADLRMLLV